MRQKLDDEFRETERGGVRGVLAEGRPRVARERTVHPARTKHFEEEMTKATSILFTLEVPGHAIRLATAIDSGRDGPSAGRYRDRQPPFAIEYLDERRRPMRPREGIPVGHAKLRLMGARSD